MRYQLGSECFTEYILRQQNHILIYVIMTTMFENVSSVK